MDPRAWGGRNDGQNSGLRTRCKLLDSHAAMAKPRPKLEKVRDLSSAKPTNPSIQHPLAGQKMTGAEMIVQVLADEGVSTIFGYSGGAILPTYDAVFLHNQEHAKD